LFVGVVEVIVGIASLIWPHVTVLVLGLLFGIVLLLSGLVVLSISWGIRSVVGVILGALAIIGAIICFIHPGAGVVAILIGCALWFFMLGVAYLFAAFTGSEDRVWWGFLGVLSVIAAIIFIASPGVAITTVAILVGLAFLIGASISCSRGACAACTRPLRPERYHPVGRGAPRRSRLATGRRPRPARGTPPTRKRPRTYRPRTPAMISSIRSSTPGRAGRGTSGWRRCPPRTAPCEPKAPSPVVRTRTARAEAIPEAFLVRAPVRVLVQVTGDS
jgi:uncharacterized membrane protein HdeD (DUF308 family)